MDPHVQYAYLSVPQFEQRLAEHPVGYIPLGTLEWHGLQNVLGADALQAEGLFIRAARRFGGIVFPPFYLGPDRITDAGDGKSLIGMDSSEATKPHQKLPGSCYWVPKGLFLQMLEAQIAQAKRAGFICLIADGHGPSRKAWAELASQWEKQYDIILLSAINDFPPETYLALGDHAGRCETSTMMALHPELVNLAILEQDTWPLGVKGEDPRLSSAAYGEYILETTVNAIGQKLQELGL
ncbi:creatininase family protein [Sphaerochaeta sp. S2]|uniref:creatininase family protein n=1 Tax=Sphaerochaeta sp. S2 TaxID=2798868 RepID=UPI0018E9ACED|nr:creatininase family protein [Sphaerochaeta sp. S2]MBJ2355365.1 creatininase family protein [Sphaerochaeta sp. S2]